jgi:hypothetical protein
VSHLDIIAPLPLAQGDIVAPPELVAPVDRKPGAGESKPASENTKPKIGITCQFRDGSAMVYDLKTGLRRIELRIQASPTTPTGWSVAMVMKAANESHSREAEGATRRCALEALERSSGNLLSADEWTGLRAALADVRAL